MVDGWSDGKMMGCIRSDLRFGDLGMLTRFSWNGENGNWGLNDFTKTILKGNQFSFPVQETESYFVDGGSL